MFREFNGSLSITFVLARQDSFVANTHEAVMLCNFHSSKTKKKAKGWSFRKDILRLESCCLGKTGKCIFSKKM